MSPHVVATPSEPKLASKKCLGSSLADLALSYKEPHARDVKDAAESQA